MVRSVEADGGEWKRARQPSKLSSSLPAEREAIIAARDLSVRNVLLYLSQGVPDTPPIQHHRLVFFSRHKHQIHQRRHSACSHSHSPPAGRPRQGLSGNDRLHEPPSWPPPPPSARCSRAWPLEVRNAAWDFALLLPSLAPSLPPIVPSQLPRRPPSARLQSPPSLRSKASSSKDLSSAHHGAHPAIATC